MGYFGGIALSLAELQQQTQEEKRDYQYDYDVHRGNLNGLSDRCESRLRESVAR